MKKKILFGAVVLFLAWAATSCEDNCGFCKTVTYEDGVVINSDTEREYCGSDLIKQKAIPDIKVGALTTKVECR